MPQGPAGTGLNGGGRMAPDPRNAPGGKGGRGDGGGADEVERLLAYADATYRLVTEQRRRLAAVALFVALCFLALAAAAGYGWADARAQASEVQDAALAEAFGVRIPDPRPALERLELRTRALVFGVVALTSGATGLLALGVWAIVRPSPPPPRFVTPTRRCDGQG